MLSEDIIVKWITRTLQIFPSDAVAIDLPDNRRIIVNVDAFDGRLHWPPILDAYSAGLRASYGSISDVIVKGARPLAVLIALRIPRNFNLEALKEFIRGVLTATKELNATYLGGDTDVTEDDVFRAEVVSVGAPAGKILSRRGAKPGDLIAATGDFGTSSVIYETINGAPSPPILPAALKTWLKPKWPPLEKWLEYTNLITSSIDNSDGLALELHYLATSSNVRIELDEVPVYKPLLEYYSEKEALERALYLSGEEYNFIFTVPPEHEWIISQLSATILGKIREGEGVYLKGYGAVKRSGWISGWGWNPPL